MNRRLTIVIATIYAASVGCVDSGGRPKDSDPPASIELEIPRVTVKTIARADTGTKIDEFEDFIITVLPAFPWVEFGRFPFGNGLVLVEPSATHSGQNFSVFRGFEAFRAQPAPILIR